MNTTHKTVNINKAGRLLALLLVALLFAACEKPSNTSESAPEPESAAPSPAASPAPARRPETAVAAAPATTPVPAPPAPELAPPGVFFLIGSASVETSDGIVGLKPGQQLKLVKPGTYLANGHELGLREDQVTNDMAFARAVAVQDARTQAAIQSRLAGPPKSAGAASASAQNQPPSAPVAAQAPTAPTRAPMGNTALDNNGGVGNAHDKTVDHKRWHKTITGSWIYN